MTPAVMETPSCNAEHSELPTTSKDQHAENGHGPALEQAKAEVSSPSLKTLSTSILPEIQSAGEQKTTFNGAHAAQDKNSPTKNETSDRNTHASPLPRDADPTGMHNVEQKNTDLSIPTQENPQRTQSLSDISAATSPATTSNHTRHGRMTNQLHFLNRHVLRILRNHSSAVPFKVPVDWKKLNIPVS